ncbi:MAG: hypothetical protein JWN76_2487 [Chitinophagaceae bacterium]|nr:hypothetical protein [Chitinophagaceae bacterium]
MMRLIIILPVLAFLAESSVGVYIHDCTKINAVREFAGKSSCAMAGKHKSCCSHKKKPFSQEKKSCKVAYKVFDAKAGVEGKVLKQLLLAVAPGPFVFNHNEFDVQEVVSPFFATGPPLLYTRYRYLLIQHFII